MHDLVFALKVTYLTGRVYSAVCDDGDAKRTPEWPPHPSRLFSALVAAWGEGGAEHELRPALRWMEEQSPPVIYAGEAMPRKLLQAFVPVNDAHQLPENRVRKPRTFPSAWLTSPDLYFVWDAEPSACEINALSAILRRTSSLGHSSSLVALEIASCVPNGKWIVWRPGASKGSPLRIPYRGRLQELENSYDDFQQRPGKFNRPSPGRTILYSRENERPATVGGGLFDTMIVLRRDAGPRAFLSSTLSITTALRGAIQKLAPDPLPEFVSGHAPKSTTECPKRTEYPHIALAPLAFAAAPHATGEILGIAVLLPRTLNQEEQTLCWNTVNGIRELYMPWGRWTVSLADAEERLLTLQPETWSRPHTVWSSVTPFVFDRYPKDPHGSEAMEVVRAAFVRVGLPEPCEIDVHHNPWHRGVPRASLFRPARARPGKPQRYHCHVWARFKQPIQGPVIAGAGRYYGYGLFAPLFA